MSTKEKRLKDPIYGYISIESSVLHEIIDTAAFQRLRRIRQTGYEPLYSSALHNRFIHSLGVYHLGMIALESIVSDICCEYKDVWNSSWGDDFKLACLLHDIGHSPFSHSGENFYDFDDIGKKIKQILNSASFDTDFDTAKAQSKICKHHELMSAYIGIKTYSNSIKDKEFFVRCITGYTYTISGMESSTESHIKNALILLLNSPCIDVDKIDYLLRDAYVTGFDTIAIDYERLLKNIGFTIAEKQGDTPLVFKKGAISVLENVIYAHDAEQKWIQNHPVIKYETFIVQYIIKKVKEYYEKNYSVNLFSEEALTEKGLTLLNGAGEQSEENCVRLLCDDDIIFSMKNFLFPETDTFGLMSEYFDRTKRRHAIWKSESEYRAIFDAGELAGIKETFQEQLLKLESFLIEQDCPILNEVSAKRCKLVCNNNKKRIGSNKKLSDSDKNLQNARYDDILSVIRILKKLSKQCKIPFDFVILKAKRFKSGFTTEALKYLRVEFPDLKQTLVLEKINSTLKSEKNEDLNEFFYLFYKRENNQSIDLSKFISVLKKY